MPRCPHAVTGSTAALAHPALVCDVAIGQSTLGHPAGQGQPVLPRPDVPPLPDHRRHRCTPAPKSLASNRTRPSRDAPPTGLAALRMTTIDQADRLVLDFYRCAMLPLRPDAGETGHDDDLSAIGTDLPPAPDPTAGLGRRRVPPPGARPALRSRTGRDRVCTAPPTWSAARPELARLSLNIAATHHDSRVGGQRLVYGGHTIGLALAQATRLLPNLVTVLGWESCDHTGPGARGRHPVQRTAHRVRRATPAACWGCGRWSTPVR